MGVRVSADNKQRLSAMRRAIDALPALEQQLWKRRVAAKLRTGPAGDFAVAGAVPISEWNGEPARLEKEWDLELANWLDGVYTTVSDRVEEVASKGAAAVSMAGWSLWPLAIAAVAIAFALRSPRAA